MLGAMGCDIHEYYEIRRNGVWEPADLHPVPDTSGMSLEEEDRIFEAHWGHPLDLDRDYDLFALLAGVRNSIEIEPITTPRGLPDDLSAALQAIWTEVEVWCHHPSWLTLDELLRFDWDQPLRDLDLSEVGVKRRLDREVRTYRDLGQATGLLSRVVPYLQTQVADPADLRLVFWFDN